MLFMIDFVIVVYATSQHDNVVDLKLCQYGV